MNLEHHLIEVLEELHLREEFSGKERVIDILAALKGYLTEDGTSNEQDLLLQEIGVLE